MTKRGPISKHFFGRFLLQLIPILIMPMIRACFSLQSIRILQRSVTRVRHNGPLQKQQHRYLNRFLFDPEEIDQDHDDNDNIDCPVVTLPKDDYRTIHAAKILGLQNGDTIRAGLVSCQKIEKDDTTSINNNQEPPTNTGFLTDTATIQWIPEGKVKKAEPLGNGNPPGSIQIKLEHLVSPPPSQQPTVALILALPRPLALGRMLPMIAQMGVSDVILTQAAKVPKDYFGSHLFRRPEQLRARLVEGLCQAGDVRLPNVHIVKNLKHFLEDDLDEMFPLEKYARVMAHPQRKVIVDDNGNEQPLVIPKRMRDIDFPTESSSAPPRILLAVGPEGGWEEPGELDRFQLHKFQQITLGTRILRSDCAVVSLLALAHDVCHDKQV